MEQIAGFIIGNRLRVTARNLAIAHAAFSGLDPNLRRAIELAIERGEPVTQQWLDEVAAGEEKANNDGIVEELVEKLDSSLAEFSKNTKRAQQHTRRYSKELEQQIGDLERGESAERVMDDLTGLTRAMLERSRKAEAELKKREKETAALKRNLDKAKRDAEIDHLTGLPNRRAFDQRCQEEIARADGAGGMALIMADIDHFKSVNDTYGHGLGDDALVAFAAALAGSTRDGDLVARLGGEEFCVLLPDGSIDEAERIAERIRQAVLEVRVEGIDRVLSASFGVARLGASEGVDALLIAADKALYEAKEQGRNRVVVKRRSAD
jgi:diguanylate cyclase